MSGLITVEPRASRWNRQRERLVAEWSKHDKEGQRLERELKKLDRTLIVRFVDPRVDGVKLKDRVVGVRPSRWHIIKRGRGDKELDHYLPIMGPNGEYRPPSLQVVDDMKKADLWARGGLERVYKAQREALEAQEREAALEAEQRKDESRQIFEAAKRTRGDGGMTKNFDRKRGPAA